MAERFARQSATSGRSPERQTNPALARPGPEYAGILHVKEGRTGRKMNRIVSATSTLLVVAGLVILAYVGISYARSLPPSAHHWSAGQEARGKRLAASLVHHQRVAIPKSLQGTRSSVGSEPATWMTIPKIDLSAPVVQTGAPGGVWGVADWAVGHLNTSANAGAPGNGAYAAHDDIKGEIFKRLGEVGPGDAIYLRAPRAVYKYVVVRQLTVDPTNVSVLAPTRQPTITLVSCVPYWVDTQRLIVQAILKSSTRR